MGRRHYDFETRINKAYRVGTRFTNTPGGLQLTKPIRGLRFPTDEDGDLWCMPTVDFTGNVIAAQVDSVTATAIGDTTVTDPGAGNRFVLLYLSISIAVVFSGVDTFTVKITDGAGGSVIWQQTLKGIAGGGTQIVNAVVPIDYKPTGLPSSNVANKLIVNLSEAAPNGSVVVTSISRVQVN